MKRIAYDYIGCKKCWGADARIALVGRFPDLISADSCGILSPANAIVTRLNAPDTERLS